MNFWSKDWADCNPFVEQDSLEFVDFQRDKLVTNFVMSYFGKKIQVKWDKDREGNSEDAFKFIELSSLFYGDAKNNDERRNATKKLFKLILTLISEGRVNGDTMHISTSEIGYLGYEHFKRNLKEKIEKMDSQIQDNTILLEKIANVLKIKEQPVKEENNENDKDMS